MKTTISKSELIEFDACEDGFELFIEKHGDKTVKLSQCFESNALDDVSWLLRELECRDLLSVEQLKDLRLFAADCAESVLHIFEREHPDNNRPRLAIKASRDFANGLIGKGRLHAAWSAARYAAWYAARYANSDAAMSAAWSAAWSAAKYAAWYAANSKHERELKSIFLKWESSKQPEVK